jgi:transcriptional regulator with XRE-family HTH domain
LSESDGEINKRIYAARKALGLTQTEFGEGINITQAQVGNIELNKRNVNDRLITLFSVTYGINEAWLRTGTGGMFQHPGDHKLERVIRNFKQLDDLLQDYVLKQLDLLLEYKQQKDDLTQ